MEHSGNVLAFMGDAYLSVQVRDYLISLGMTNLNKLQKASTHFVSATAQAKFVHWLLDEALLSDQEITAFKRGRNAKSTSVAKNADVLDYRMATGLEALWGMLYFEGQFERLDELFNYYKQEVNL